MMRAAPARRAPWTIETPIPPRPATKTVAPSGTFAVLSTAPTPVWIAQPITQTMSRGASSGTLTALSSLTTVYSPKPATPSPRWTTWPARDSGEVPSARRPVMKLWASTHRLGCSRTQ